MSRWLCTDYEGPRTWETPRKDWCDPDESYALPSYDQETAADESEGGE